MKTKLFVTEKGAGMKSNKWKVGQEISVHENIAKSFISKGIAAESEQENENKKSKNENKKSK